MADSVFPPSKQHLLGTCKMTGRQKTMFFEVLVGPLPFFFLVGLSAK